MTKIDAPIRAGRASRSMRRAMAAIILTIVLVAGVGLGLGGCVIEVGNGTDSTASSGTTLVRSTTTDSREAADPSSNVVDAGDGLASPAQAVGQILGPSVVNIKATMVISQGPFGQQEYPIEGSGVIYTPDGMIITNNHVVTDDYGDPVTDLKVTLATGEILPATIVGRDPVTDLAIIKVNTDMELPAATFVAGEPKVGEYAVAIGSPLGYENTVTLGIVSGLNRSIEGVYGTEGVALNNLIQTDAPISPGNSGGALGNGSGQVIGINVAYESPQAGAVAIGFAIPSVVVIQVADEIIKTGKATHAYLGVSTQTVTGDLQDQFGLSRKSGVLVAQVTPGGPASKAGMRQGDIIIEIDGEKMTESADVLVAIRDKKPGETVTVTFDRNGTTMDVTATLAERPAGL